MGSDCLQAWQNRVHGKVVTIRNGNSSIVATRPVSLGAKSPVDVGREGGEEVGGDLVCCPAPPGTPT